MSKDRRRLREIASEFPTLKESHERILMLEKLAYLDTATALPNKRHFDESIADIAARPYSGVIGIVWLDIDNFAEINRALKYLGANKVLERPFPSGRMNK